MKSNGIVRCREQDERIGEARSPPDWRNISITTSTMNGDDPSPGDGVSRAWSLALRYGCEFVSLDDFQLESELLKKIPGDLMFRYNFVPVSELPDGRVAIAIADPSQLMLVDEIGLLLGSRLVICVAALAQIVKVLRKG